MDSQLVLSDLKIINLLLTESNDVSCHVALGVFPEMTQEQKIFFDLSVVDIKWENKGYSICRRLHKIITYLFL